MAEILDVVQRLCEEEIVPHAQDIDRSEEFPSGVYARFNEIGLVALLVPEALGGAGSSLLEISLVYEVIAKASSACCLILANSAEALVPVVAYARPSLRDEVLGRVLGEGQIPCFALTEPGAGSDATGIRTRAARGGEEWILSGEKALITNGSVGDLFLVFAVTEPTERKSRRLSAFVVDRDTPGFEIGPDEHTLGNRGSPLSRLMFEDARLPADRIVGEPGQGFEVAMRMLNESRVGAAAQCVGIADAALERSALYASEREQFGRRIADFQAVQLLLADIQIRTEASRSLTHTAARAHDAGDGRAVSLAAMCKVVASDAAVQSALDAIQVHGGYGCCREFEVERLLRDAKAYQIFDGTNEIQRLTVAKQLLRNLPTRGQRESRQHG
jgi:alkylation response protein AidB-like acyl-CoA dehydrogenase